MPSEFHPQYHHINIRKTCTSQSDFISGDTRDVTTMQSHNLYISSVATSLQPDFVSLYSDFCANNAVLSEYLFKSPFSGSGCRMNWLVGCFGFGWLFWVLRPFETIFQSISGHFPQRGRKRRDGIDEIKNVQTTPTRTYCKLLYIRQYML